MFCFRAVHQSRMRLWTCWASSQMRSQMAEKVLVNTIWFILQRLCQLVVSQWFCLRVWAAGDPPQRQKRSRTETNRGKNGFEFQNAPYSSHMQTVIFWVVSYSTQILSHIWAYALKWFRCTSRRWVERFTLIWRRPAPSLPPILLCLSGKLLLLFSPLHWHCCYVIVILLMISF